MGEIIMIDEDEAYKKAEWIDTEVVPCPKGGHSMVWGANFCSECGVQVVWVTKPKAPFLKCDACTGELPDVQHRRYWDVSIKAMSERNFCDGCYADIKKVDVPDGYVLKLEKDLESKRNSYDERQQRGGVR